MSALSNPQEAPQQIIGGWKIVQGGFAHFCEACGKPNKGKYCRQCYNSRRCSEKITLRISCAQAKKDKRRMAKHKRQHELMADNPHQFAFLDKVFEGRRFLSLADFIALFPLIPATVDGWDIQSYQHIGQHAAASPWITRKTRTAKPSEYAPLMRELESIGYKLKVGQRFPRNAYDVRKAALTPKLAGA